MPEMEDMEELMEDQDTLEEEMVENEDGSVTLLGPEEEEVDNSFDNNLAETLDESILDNISKDLLDLIEVDRESRTKRDEQYAEGLRRTGLGDDLPAKANFEGASDVVHPVLAEACVDYSSSMIKEVFPPDGPVKTKMGTKQNDPNRLERAERKRDFLNWQLTEQMPEYRSSLEVLATQQPLGGSQFLKFWYDSVRNRPCCEFIPIDRVFLPFSAYSFESSPRATIMVTLTQMQYEKRVKAGLYRDVDVIAPSLTPDQTKSEGVNDSIEGKTEDAYNEDGLRVAYEIYVEYEIEGEDSGGNYIITIDEHTQKVLSIYRNWDPEDQAKEKLEWIVEWPFIPWRGAYGIGLYHLIGGLSKSATGALRALLDSAHINNFPAAVRLKGSGRNAGQTIKLSPTEIAELEGAAGVDDIRKLVMPMPFNQPSSVLFSLLGFVVDAAKGVVAVADEKIGDATNNMPVGTALALIEQGSKVFSAIHARQHVSQAKVLKILCRLNAQNFNPETQIKRFGELLVPQEDFLDSSDIVPVSDPNIYSESQRYAQIQGVLQLMSIQDPTVQWNRLAVYQRVLRIMHVDNPDELLPPQPEPVSADPLSEIVAAMSGQQIRAVPGMPHQKHIQEELSYILDPVFGAGNPTNMNPGFQVIMSDVKQHLLLMYQEIKTQIYQQVSQMVLSQARPMYEGLPEEQAQEVIGQILQDPNTQSLISSLTEKQYQEQVQSMQGLVQMMSQADELVKQRTPQPPPDPAIAVQLQVAQMDIQRKSQLDQATLNMKGQQHQLNQQMEAARLQMDQQQQQFDQQLEKQRQMVETMATQLAQQVEIQKNREDNQQHQMTELLKNHEDNQTNLVMEQMRQEGLRQREELQQQMKAYQAEIDKMIKLMAIRSNDNSADT